MKRDYQSYLRQWYEKKEQLEKKGIEMYQSEPSSEVNFNMNYTGTYNERKLLVKKGELKSTGNITRSIIEQEAYEFSFKQAKAFKNALADKSSLKSKAFQEDLSKVNLKNLSLQDLRNGGHLTASQARQILFDEAKRIYKDEKKAGKTPEQASKKVRQVVFGSK